MRYNNPTYQAIRTAASHSMRPCLIVLLLLLLTACSSEVADVQQPEVGQESAPRPLVPITFEACLEDPSAAPTTRVAYTQGAGEINRTWATSETLGVYIKHTNGTITYAGTIASSGATTDITRTFSGEVSMLQSGETYVYMHPSLNDNDDDNDDETVGQAARGTINYASQTGALNSTAHLSDLIPMVWCDGKSVADMQGYVVRLVMTFNEDPGTINSVALQTMSMGDDGQTADCVFPTAFRTANLAKDVNSTLATPKTSGLTLASNGDYTGTITLSVTSGSATDNGDGTYTAEAYLACADIHNLDVFRSKYNVKVTAANGTYYSTYKSFPGQSNANATDGLSMLQNGKSYKLTAKMSKSYAPTIISEQFKVNSLLGMWNQYGKAYDPLGLVVYEGGSATLPATGLPSQLTSNKAAILNRYKNNGIGTPTWLGIGTNSLYDMTAAAIGDTRQGDVTINNITINAPTEVFVTFISEYGWNENLLGYYHYNGSAPSSQSAVTKTLIFPNVSKPGHEPFRTGGAAANNIGTDEDAPLKEFETVKLLYTDANGYASTTFPAGTTIGFMMMIDPEAREDAPRTGYDLMKWSQWRLFTNTKWNAENTSANGASANWSSAGYPRNNFFASGDVCSDENGTKIPGLAIYGVKDNATNDANTAYGAMIFMVSTSDPAAMQTQNKASFNIGTGNLVINNNP